MSKSKEYFLAKEQELVSRSILRLRSSFAREDAEFRQTDLYKRLYGVPEFDR